MKSKFGCGQILGKPSRLTYDIEAGMRVRFDKGGFGPQASMWNDAWVGRLRE